ncbi:UDP-2,3-diacylglucosamine diphosphatase [Idiomarina seosinensis]|uniref:UDP-2,3-diacylglucosamine diphosphatase n=1 Tax=Idiomarina seosinensis TaxID=281739 RepID=UPI00384A4829
MTTGFIADLHLTPARPDITAAFRQFCQSHQQLTALYILGDLFDAWLGDDDSSLFAENIKEILAGLSANGVKLYFMPGNRDFLLGDVFARATGMQRLADETVITLNGIRTLLMHGDTLCTADTGYQRYRSFIQHPFSRYALKRLPFNWRMAIARKLRTGSQSQRPHLSHERLRQMDVQHQAVLEVMQKHQVQQLIHGHTHRAAIHEFKVNGAKAKRVVLGDWYDAQRLIGTAQSGYYSGIYIT